MLMPFADFLIFSRIFYPDWFLFRFIVKFSSAGWAYQHNKLVKSCLCESVSGC